MGTAHCDFDQPQRPLGKLHGGNDTLGARQLVCATHSTRLYAALDDGTPTQPDQLCQDDKGFWTLRHAGRGVCWTSWRLN